MEARPAFKATLEAYYCMKSFKGVGCCEKYKNEILSPSQ